MARDIRARFWKERVYNDDQKDNGSAEFGECFYNNKVEIKRKYYNWKNCQHGRSHLGENVWSGIGFIILKGIVIGDNCVIGAGTVLQGKIPNNSLVKYRSDITVKVID